MACGEASSVYAIVRTGGKQYRVQAGDTIHVERLEAPLGGKVTLEDVLLVGGDQVKVGVPKIDKAAVVGTVVAQDRDSKLRVFKYKKRKHYRRTRGHRQAFTAVRIDSIEA